MADEGRATRFDDEIAEIENRRGKRNLFLVLGGVFVLILLGIVVFGARERARLDEEAARPRTEPVELGALVGVVGGTALFARGESLSYVEGIREGTEVTDQTRFVRQVEYTPGGEPDAVPPGTTHWSVVSADSVPYVVEHVTHPLTGVNPIEYHELNLGALRPSDYGSGGPNDWRPLEQGEERVRVTGRPMQDAGSAYIADLPARVRLQGIEGLSAIDSLELTWATRTRAPLTAYGRITTTPRGGDPLFVMVVSTLHPPAPAAPADTTIPPDTATPAGTTP